MKNIKLLTKIMALAMVLVFTNCQKEDDIVTAEAQTEKSLILEIEQMPFSALKSDHQVFATDFNRNNAPNIDNSNRDISEGIAIETSSVKQITYGEYTSYTFSTVSEGTETVLENVMISEVSEDVTEYYLVSYQLDVPIDDIQDEDIKDHVLNITVQEIPETAIVYGDTYRSGTCYEVTINTTTYCYNSEGVVVESTGQPDGTCDGSQGGSFTVTTTVIEVDLGCNNGGGGSGIPTPNLPVDNGNPSDPDVSIGTGGQLPYGTGITQGTVPCRNRPLDISADGGCGETLEFLERDNLNRTLSIQGLLNEAQSHWIFNTAAIDIVIALNDFIESSSSGNQYENQLITVDLINILIENQSSEEALNLVIDYITVLNDANNLTQQLDFPSAIQHLTQFLRLYREEAHEIMADYYESLIEEIPTMQMGEVWDIYNSLKEIADDIPMQYFNAILNVYVSDLIIPIITYALFEASTNLAIKLLEKIPLPAVLVGTRLNRLILKTTQLGNPGALNSKLIPNSTVTKAEALFTSLTKNATSIVPAANNPAIKVAHMGNGTKIILRPTSTTVPEAVSVIEYQNFNSLLGTNSYTLKFIP